MVVKPRILGVLGGRDLPLEMLRNWATTADRIFAADSGADQLLAIGSSPEIVIGDMDSVSPQGLDSALDVLVQPTQDYTDCDKLLQYAVNQGVVQLTLCGIEGDRLDHVLSSLYSCVRSQIKTRVALRRGLGHILKKGEYVFETQPGRRLSLLPLGEAEGVSLRGVRWEVSDATLQPGGITSVSNVSTETSINVSLSSGAALLVMEYPQEEMPIW